MRSGSILVLRDHERRSQHHHREPTTLPQNALLIRPFVHFLIVHQIHRQLLSLQRFHPAATAQTCKLAANEIVPITFRGPIDK
jgi:hypothetical protein